MNKILVLNSGSSSIKVKVFDEKFNLLLEALLERIGTQQIGLMQIKWNSEKFEAKHQFKDHKVALTIFLEWLKTHNVIQNFNQEVKAIGHRVVMGGDVYTNPTLVNEKVLKSLEQISTLAPLHNPANILGVKQIQALINKPNVLVFDTGFHQTLNPVKYLYPLPYQLYEDLKIRKYGMHGISYEYTTKKFIKELKIKTPNLIIFHLGNGCSVSAIKAGKSFNTSMGLTPLAGLMMGTRSGDIDPAIITFLQRQKKLTSDNIDEILNKQSGLLGVSQKTNDMRDILALKKSNNKQATLAFEIFIDRLVKFYAEYLNDLDNQLDGIIFTGGIGYNSQDVVKAFVDKVKISQLKLQLDWKNLAKGFQLISHQNSEFKIFISETNEELEIAQQTIDLLAKL